MRILLVISVLFFSFVDFGPSTGQNARPPNIEPGSESRPYAGGTLITPQSSLRKSADDIGIHTHHFIFVPPINRSSKAQPKGPPYTGYNFNTPASVACIYKQVPQSSGCDPYKVTVNASGGSRAIGIVVAYDAPNIATDLAVFSRQFDLPEPTAATLEVVYASGSKPAYDVGWEREATLDVEMAHAMAPDAKIILVEAIDVKPENLLAAVDKASQLVVAAGGGEVSMSWIGIETVNESSYDVHFTTEGVVYLGCSGDGYGPLWPSVSSKLVAVGATTILRDAGGAFTGEIPWLFEGAGLSKFIPRPAYQDAVADIVGNARGVPDITAVGDPATGVWAYDSNFGGEFNGWFVASGSSASTPIVAGIINRAGHFYRSTADELAAIYGALSNPNDYNDITNGVCGPSQKYEAGPGWDFCTGVGSPNGTGGK
ncbi:MAG: hypothetical protein JO328_00795 [Hyphomicrobiales bacterium]|nr:hypothetical protein [Hyphomicrobiales bacterium]MBV8823392.1 hypothetical protein [Hyphomicrobiales bacterium]MBV9426671.1 hypothetical protein [Bradyrhizobiaceae bacterium]